MILVLNQYYAPDTASSGQYAADLCSGLAVRGMNIHVVKGQPSYSRTSPHAPSYEFLKGAHVHRVRLGKRRGREKMKTRIAGYLCFLLGAWIIGRKLLKYQTFEAILTFSNPPIIGLVGARLAQKKGIRYISVLHDIHPDILLASGWNLPRPLVWAWEMINNYIFRQADRVIVLTEDMKQNLVRKKGVLPAKIQVIPLWGNPEIAPSTRTTDFRNEWNIGENELLLISAGNLGITYPLDVILDAAKALSGQPVRFFVIGDGVQRKRMMYRVINEKIRGVELIPFQPKEQFIQLIKMSDICLAGLQPGIEDIAFPSRVFTYLSAGRPVIIMKQRANGTHWITEEGCGWNVNNGQELVKLILNLLKDRSAIENRGYRARELYKDRFEQSIIIDEYANIF